MPQNKTIELFLILSLCGFLFTEFLSAAFAPFLPGKIRKKKSVTHENKNIRKDVDVFDLNFFFFCLTIDFRG